MALVRNDEASRLWNTCVFDDPESPSALDRDGCLCMTTFYDPLTCLPVVKEHYRTVSGNIERWDYWTFSPLSLPEGQALERLIIDRDAGVMWLRNDRGELHFLPEERGEGYEVGYSGSGPGNLADMIEKFVASDGHDVTPNTHHVTAHPHRISNRRKPGPLGPGGADPAVPRPPGRSAAVDSQTGLLTCKACRSRW